VKDPFTATHIVLDKPRIRSVPVPPHLLQYHGNVWSEIQLVARFARIKGLGKRSQNKSKKVVAREWAEKCIAKHACVPIKDYEVV